MVGGRQEVFLGGACESMFWTPRPEDVAVFSPGFHEHMIATIYVFSSRFLLSSDRYDCFLYGHCHDLFSHTNQNSMRIQNATSYVKMKLKLILCSPYENQLSHTSGKVIFSTLESNRRLSTSFLLYPFMKDQELSSKPINLEQQLRDVHRINSSS